MCYLENHGEVLFKFHSLPFRINSVTENNQFAAIFVSLLISKVSKLLVLKMT